MKHDDVNINLTEIVRAEVQSALARLMQQLGDGNQGARTDNRPDGVRPLVGPSEVIPRQTTADRVVSKLPVKVLRPDGEVQFRRRKRTREEMREAITKALPLVKTKHPDWSERRLKRLAINLVRRYKVASEIPA